MLQRHSFHCAGGSFGGTSGPLQPRLSIGVCVVLVLVLVLSPTLALLVSIRTLTRARNLDPFTFLVMQRFHICRLFGKQCDMSEYLALLNQSCTTR